MPMLADGTVAKSLRGTDYHDAILNKCQEMRRELRHIEQAISRVEGMARAKAPLESFRPPLNVMMGWYISALESLFTVVGAAIGGPRLHATITDFQRRFVNFANT